MSRSHRAEAAEEFARRLMTYLNDRGWNQSELARRVSEKMPAGMTVGYDVISHWLRRPTIPGPVRLEALCKALNVQPGDLVPLVVPRATGSMPPIEMKADEEHTDTVWLRLNKRLPFETALKIQQLVLDGERQLREDERISR